MPGIIQKLTPIQAVEISGLLKSLFALQDKPCTDGKVALLIDELEGSGLPYPAIAAGVKSLFQQDLRAVKLSVIFDAVRQFVTFDYSTVDCGFCGREGSVILFDKEGRIFALACTCSNGDGIEKSQKLVRWNSEQRQSSRDRDLVRRK